MNPRRRPESPAPTGVRQAPRRRRGYLLAEALCALALSGVLAAAAALSLSSARRAMAKTSQLAAAERASRESVSVIASILRESASVTVEGDTAASFAYVVAIGAVCEHAGRVVILPPVDGQPAALTARAQPVEAGDMVSVLVVDSLALGAVWVNIVVDSVTQRTTAGSCGASNGWTLPADDGAVRLRLVLAGALPPQTPAGAPVRVLRRGRFSLYASGTGDWMLGWRRCSFLLSDALGCGAIQPVAGPLRTPGAGGLRLNANPLLGTIHVEARGLGPGTMRSSQMTVLLRNGP